MNKASLFLFDILKNRRTIHYLQEFERVKEWSKNEVSEYQFKKLKKLLVHAEANVPFYRRRFAECAFSVNNMLSFEDLKKIPPLTRQDLQNHWNEIIATNYKHKKLSKGSSSGSTGIPVIYYKDNLATSAGQAAHYLGWSLSGWEMSMKGLHVWGNPSTVNNEWKKLSSKFKAKLFSHHKFPAYKLTDETKFLELFELVNNEKYDFIDGYTNAIYLFADYLKRKNLPLQHKVRYVLTTAENLQAFQREIIEEMIAPIYDSYGCSEINGIAYECDMCKAYHVIDPHVYLEFGKIVDDIGSNELLITDLDNFAFPLIRYKNNDLGIPIIGNSDCKIPFSKLTGITGRQSDIIKFTDGGALSVPSFFGSMLLKQIHGLKQYQIERVSEDLIYVNFVKTRDFTDQDHQKIVSALDEYLNNRINYQIRYLDKIESSSTGKFKLLIDKTKEL